MPGELGHWILRASLVFVLPATPEVLGILPSTEGVPSSLPLLKKRIPKDEGFGFAGNLYGKG